LLEEQRLEVEAVLQELGAQDKSTLQVFNKIDLLADGSATPMPTGAIPVSGLRGKGLDGLLQAIDAALVADPLVEVRFRIPQAEGRILAAIERGSTISQQSFRGNLVYFTAVRRYWMREETPARELSEPASAQP
jgi:GTP-binding protein HflX